MGASDPPRELSGGWRPSQKIIDRLLGGGGGGRVQREWRTGIYCGPDSRGSPESSGDPDSDIAYHPSITNFPTIYMEDVTPSRSHIRCRRHVRSRRKSKYWISHQSSPDAAAAAQSRPTEGEVFRGDSSPLCQEVPFVHCCSLSNSPPPPSIKVIP